MRYQKISTNYIISLHLQLVCYLIPMLNQQKIRKENKQLRSLIQGYLQQITRLKQNNEQHQAQIQTLLKFNQRLLIIIETQLNNYNTKSERSYSLQPISEITQRESDALDPVSMKNSLAYNNIRLNELDFERKSRKQSGNETDRVVLGKGLEDQISYEASRSDYQREYSQYSQRQKYKSIMNLIHEYKQQYGQSIQQCDEAKTKIKRDVAMSSKQLLSMNEENSNFYGEKIQQLNSLKEKLKEDNVQTELKKIVNSNKYSTNTQNKLRELMGNLR